MQGLARPVTAGGAMSTPPQGQFMRQGMVTPPQLVGRAAMPQGTPQTPQTLGRPSGGPSAITPNQTPGRPLTAPPGMSRPAPGATSSAGQQ